MAVHNFDYWHWAGRPVFKRLGTFDYWARGRPLAGIMAARQSRVLAAAVSAAIVQPRVRSLSASAALMRRRGLSAMFSAAMSRRRGLGVVFSVVVDTPLTATGSSGLPELYTDAEMDTTSTLYVGGVQLGPVVAAYVKTTTSTGMAGSGTWLVVSGTTSIVAAVNNTGLPMGHYTASYTIADAHALNTPLLISVTLEVT